MHLQFLFFIGVEKRVLFLSNKVNLGPLFCCRKKKKEKEKKKLGEVTKIIEEEKPDEAVGSSSLKLTKAQLAFKKMQEKTVCNVVTGCLLTRN